MSSLPLVLSRSLLELRSQLEIGFVSVSRDLTAIHARAHRAPWLDTMRAVREAAVLEERAHLREAAVELTRVESPDADLAQSRRVHHVPALREWMQVRTDGRVTSLHHRAADLAHAEIETGEHRVQQGRFPHA